MPTAKKVVARGPIWDFHIGPAAILTFVSMVVQVVVVVWMASSIYSGLTYKIDAQGTKIQEIEKGSDKRFETVVNGIREARGKQEETIQRVTKVETALGFIASQIKSFEDAIRQQSSSPGKR